VKFTEKVVKLDISILKATNSNTTIRFAVSIPNRNLKENQTKIFKAFSRRDSSTTKKNLEVPV
jgi:hypothetical protein